MTLAWLLFRIVLFVGGLYFGVVVARRRRAAQAELRQTRDQDQIALFQKPLPPRPSVVVRPMLRVACGACGELYPESELRDVGERFKRCDGCLADDAREA